MTPPVPPLRIGLVTPAWPGTATANGIASATASLAEGLEALGHQTTILAVQIDAAHDHPRAASIPHVRPSLLQRLRFRLTPDTVIRELTVSRLVAGAKEAIARHDIQVLMIEESFGWAGELRRMLPIPVVVTLHGPHWLHRLRPGKPGPGPDARREAWEAAGLHHVTAILSPSRNVLDRTHQEWGLPDVPMTVIGNPVRIPALDQPSAALADPHILFVGRFDRIKGADVLMAAFAKVSAAHPDCRLTFIGPDSGVTNPDGSTLHLADALARLPDSARARVDILGPQSRDQISALRRRHPITVIASRYETFGVALIEAMAAGSAVVSTRVGGCAEILRDGETGLLVPPEDPEALAAACLRLLNDRALTLRLGTAARADVASRFAPEVVAREVASFLAPLCQT